MPHHESQDFIHLVEPAELVCVRHLAVEDLTRGKLGRRGGRPALTIARERFDRSTLNLTEAVSGFRPARGTMTAAQHVAHAARVIDWFMEGAFRSEGFDMNFEEQVKQVMAVESLAAARAWFENAVTNAIAVFTVQSDTDLMTPLPPGPVLGGTPRFAIIREIIDHTAHHRGALTVYARINHRAA